MAWLKLDDGFAEHSKIEALSAQAFRLHVTALCMAARKLTDGVVTEKDAKVCSVIAHSRPRHVQELEAAGLWNRNENGWHINDYLEYNPSAKQVKEERRKAAERMRERRSGGESSPDVRPNVRPNNQRTSPVRSGTPSRPVPKQQNIIPSKSTKGVHARQDDAMHTLAEIAMHEDRA